MTEKLCAAPECDRPYYARGYCTVHYKRLRRHGDILANEPVGMYGEASIERMRQKLTGRKTGPCTPERAAAISAAKKGRSNGIAGRPVSEATRAKLSAANSGPRNHGWKGDDVGYVALHERARKAMEKTCQHCGATERLDAALRKDAGGPFRTGVMLVSGKDRTLTYSVTVSDYFALCRPCHKKYDTTP